MYKSRNLPEIFNKEDNGRVASKNSTKLVTDDNKVSETAIIQAYRNKLVRKRSNCNKTGWGLVDHHPSKLTRKEMAFFQRPGDLLKLPLGIAFVNTDPMETIEFTDARTLIEGALSSWDIWSLNGFKSPTWIPRAQRDIGISLLDASLIGQPEQTTFWLEFLFGYFDICLDALHDPLKVLEKLLKLDIHAAQVDLTKKYGSKLLKNTIDTDIAGEVFHEFKDVKHLLPKMKRFPVTIIEDETLASHDEPMTREVLQKKTTGVAVKQIRKISTRSRYFKDFHKQTRDLLKQAALENTLVLRSELTVLIKAPGYHCNYHQDPGHPCFSIYLQKSGYSVVHLLPPLLGWFVSHLSDCPNGRKYIEQVLRRLDKEHIGTYTLLKPGMAMLLAPTEVHGFYVPSYKLNPQLEPAGLSVTVSNDMTIIQPTPPH